LGMLCPGTPSPGADGPYHHWDLYLAAEHVAPFGRMIDQLVQRKQQKIHTGMDKYRPQAGYCRSDRYSCQCVFCYRRVEYPVGSILLLQPLGGPENACYIVHSFSHDEYCRIPCKRLIQRFVQSVFVSEDPTALCFACYEIIFKFFHLDRRPRHKNPPFSRTVPSGRLFHWSARITAFCISTRGLSPGSSVQDCPQQFA